MLNYYIVTKHGVGPKSREKKKKKEFMMLDYIFTIIFFMDWVD